MAAIGHVFALFSAGCVGFACGTLIERRTNTVHISKSSTTSTTTSSSSSSVTSSLPPARDGAHSPPQDSAAAAPHLSRMLRNGLPTDERVRCFDGFIASLNYERRVPNWVLEYFPSDTAVKDEADSQAAVSREGMRFFADSNVPEAFRVLPDDYSNAARHPEARGLSRGHLAAAQFHKSGAEEMAQTFNMNANIVPQDMTMNAVDWLRLENLTRKARRWYEGGVWVVSGPVFLPRHFCGSPRVAPAAPLIPITNKNSSSSSSSSYSLTSSSSTLPAARKVVCYELVGKHDVAVPTHLFKVILGEKANGTHEIAAFLMPNGPIPEERPLIEYQVPVSTIEQATGLQFFSHIAPKSGSRRSIDSMTNMCARQSCEVRTASLFHGLRNVARLRAAQSVPELQRVYTSLVGEQSGDNKGKLDAAVMKEYSERMRELVEEAVSEID